MHIIVKSVRSKNSKKKHKYLSVRPNSNTYLWIPIEISQDNYVCLFVWWCLTPLFQLYFSYTVSWRPVLLVEETEWLEQKHRPVASHRKTLSHNVVHLTLIELTTSVVIGADCIGSCKSNYHAIRKNTAPHGMSDINEFSIILKSQ